MNKNHCRPAAARLRSALKTAAGLNVSVALSLELFASLHNLSTYNELLGSSTAALLGTEDARVRALTRRLRQADFGVSRADLLVALRSWENPPAEKPGVLVPGAVEIKRVLSPAETAFPVRPAELLAEVPGHMLVVGSPGSGKTVMVCRELTGAMNWRGRSVIGLDDRSHLERDLGNGGFSVPVGETLHLLVHAGSSEPVDGVVQRAGEVGVQVRIHRLELLTAGNLELLADRLERAALQLLFEQRAAFSGLTLALLQRWLERSGNLSGFAALITKSLERLSVPPVSWSAVPVGAAPWAPLARAGLKEPGLEFWAGSGLPAFSHVERGLFLSFLSGLQLALNALVGGQAQVPGVHDGPADLGTGRYWACLTGADWSLGQGLMELLGDVTALLLLPALMREHQDALIWF